MCSRWKEEAIIGATNTSDAAAEARITVESRNSIPFHHGTRIPNPTTATRKETTVERLMGNQSVVP
jgi:hypothetical protein